MTLNRVRILLSLLSPEHMMFLPEKEIKIKSFDKKIQLLEFDNFSRGNSLVKIKTNVAI